MINFNPGLFLFLSISDSEFLRSTKENAYYSSPARDPAGSALDAMRFHGLGAILDWLAGTFCLDLMCSVFLALELVSIL